MEPAYQDISDNTTADLPGTSITAQTQVGSVRGKEVQIGVPTADRICTVDVELMMHDITSCKHLFIPNLSLDYEMNLLEVHIIMSLCFPLYTLDYVLCV